MSAQCPRSPEEGIRFSGTRVTAGCETPWGAGNGTQVLVRAASALSTILVLFWDKITGAEVGSWEGRRRGRGGG